MTSSALIGNLDPASLDLAMSPQGRPLYDRVVDFVATEVEPVTAEFFRLGEDRAERWGYGPGQLELLRTVSRTGPKRLGCGTSSCPMRPAGRASATSTTPISQPNSARIPSPRSASTAAPPTPATWRCWRGWAQPSRREQWLKPLLAGEIRSCYAMTEPTLASSDAKNIATQAVLDGDEWLDQRREVLHLRSWRPALQDHDLHGADQSRRPPAPAPIPDPGAHGHPGSASGGSDARFRGGRRSPRPHAPPP